jgi:UDP-glucose 4-epimerase
MHILVCGGAGYIGSHMARWLALRDHRVTVLDNLSTGHREAVQWGDWSKPTCSIPARSIARVRRRRNSMR